MTKDLGRISKLKDSIDTLTYITSAIKIIKEETGMEWDDEPELSIQVAKNVLAKLKKKETL